MNMGKKTAIGLIVLFFILLIAKVHFLRPQMTNSTTESHSFFEFAKQTHDNDECSGEEHGYGRGSGHGYGRGRYTTTEDYVKFAMFVTPLAGILAYAGINHLKSKSAQSTNT